jgi:hypothetical protein
MSDAPKITKKILNALGKVFSAEVFGRLPFQSKAKIYATLEDEGYVEKMERTFGAGQRFPITVSGYVLTHLGRMTYGQNCNSEPDG